MKILHVIPSISFLRGGPSVAVLEMVGAQRELGLDAAILTTNDAGPGVDATMPLGEWFEREGVPVMAFARWNPPINSLREFAISTGLNRWLAAHLNDYQVLHVHALFSWSSTSTMVMARRAGIPYVLSTIGQLNHWSLNQSPIRKSLYLLMIERINLASAAALHFTTQDERDQAATLGLPTPTWVIPLGVHLPSLAPHKKTLPQPVTFLFLSRIHPKKQLERLIEALALLHRRLPRVSWHLRIAGDGEPAYIQKLKQQVVRAGIAERCHWLGFLEGEAKWRALQEAVWFVLPSASENFGIAAVEALAAGTPPILSHDVAVSSAIANVGAGLITPTEPEALSFVLETALAGPSPEMQNAARKLAFTSYSWPAIAAKFQQAYSSVLR